MAYTIYFHVSNREAQILADDQIDFIKKTSEKIYELLAEIPPRGRDFVNCVKHILKVSILI